MRASIGRLARRPGQGPPSVRAYPAKLSRKLGGVLHCSVKNLRCGRSEGYRSEQACGCDTAWCKRHPTRERPCREVHFVSGTTSAHRINAAPPYSKRIYEPPGSTPAPVGNSFDHLVGDGPSDGPKTLRSARPAVLRGEPGRGERTPSKKS